MISPLAMPARSRDSHVSRGSWDDVDHVLLTALRHTGTVRDLATAANLPQDLVAAQLDVYMRDGLATRTGLDGLLYQLTLTGWKRLFRFADAATSPGHQAAA